MDAVRAESLGYPCWPVVAIEVLWLHGHGRYVLIVCGGALTSQGRGEGVAVAPVEERTTAVVASREKLGKEKG